MRLKPLGTLHNMTKSEYLSILMLLSALESWAFSTKQPLPDYLHERLDDTIEQLRREVLSDVS